MNNNFYENFIKINLCVIKTRGVDNKYFIFILLQTILIFFNDFLLVIIFFNGSNNITNTISFKKIKNIV
jgi:hypothetical protein